MPTRIIYYAMVDDFSSRDEPAGVLRRIQDDEGQDDQVFTTALKWEHTGSLYSYERGNRDNELYEISEEEADHIVARIRHTVTGEPQS